MNYYNPYLYSVPMNTTIPKVGLFSRLFGNSGITLTGILNGTQRALNFANQAIPLVKQVKPMIGNAKTMFKVMNEFKRVDTKNNNMINNYTLQTEETNNKKEKVNEPITNNNGPTFFI